MEKIRYYRTNPKNNFAYWCPTPAMRALGFEVKALGLHGPESEAAAHQWNKRWEEVQKERRNNPQQPPSDEDAQAPRAPRALYDGSYIYFLRIAQRIKIGISKDPLARMQHIVAHAADPISQIVVVPGTREDERRLHQRFRRCRVRGEWFAVTHSLKLTMTRCAMAGIVVHDELRTDDARPVESRAVENRPTVESQTSETINA